MKRAAPEKIIAAVTFAVLAAALTLGALAFVLSRHEEAFRREELRTLLRSECRLFAERCGQELEVIRTELELRAASTPPDSAGIREAVAEEPFFTGGFLADRSGALLYAGDDAAWKRRYGELFSEFVSARTVASSAPSVQNALREKQEQKSKSRLVEPVPRRDNVQRMTANNTAHFGRGDQTPAPMQAKAAPAPAAPAVHAASAASAAPRLIPRFAALTRGRTSGFIPYFADNRFVPLVWAESIREPERIVGFELESLVLWSRLIPVFPQKLPDYFRIELVDASDRVIHAAGGEPPEKREAETVLIMPFSEQLLPNAQIRASLIPGRLPLGGYRAAIWSAISAPVLVILLAGLLLYFLSRRELRLAARKAGFVSQVSHELKTPLTSIRMYSELLRDHDDGLAPPKRRRYLQVIADESERLSRLVGNVLDFSRLDEGRKRYAPSPVDLAELLESAAELCRQRAAAEGVELTLTLPPGPPAMCTIDRDSLLQVLHNLFDNALKYAAQGKKLELSLACRGRRREITLRDYGPGIPASARAKIFRKFYRVDTALEAVTSGFGLGLSIARNLMRDQKGDLKFVPASPGAAFIIVLPEDNCHGTD